MNYLHLIHYEFIHLKWLLSAFLVTMQHLSHHGRSGETCCYFSNTVKSGRGNWSKSFHLLTYFAFWNPSHLTIVFCLSLKRQMHNGMGLIVSLQSSREMMGLLTILVSVQSDYRWQGLCVCGLVPIILSSYLITPISFPWGHYFWSMTLLLFLGTQT